MSESPELHPWSADALFAKAELYVQEMENTIADDWRYGLWSALSLELLARAALASISPVLLADVRNWQNTLHALGQKITAKKFSPVSIGTREVFARLTELVPEFTEEIAGFCTQHVDRRNSELHTGELVFASIGTSGWLPKYYKACKVLLEHMNKGLDDFVAEPENAKELIASLADEAAKAVNKDINAHKTVWDAKSETDREEAILQARTWATRHAGHRAICPACASPALLHGSPTGAVSTDVNGDEVVQRQSLLPSSFECIACGLKISGYSKLLACGLGDSFTETTVLSAAEFFELYTEDDVEEARQSSAEFEPDFNEY